MQVTIAYLDIEVQQGRGRRTDIGADVAGVQSRRDRAISGNDGVVIIKSADFSLSAGPASHTIPAGGSTSYDTSITPTDGFTSTVTFQVSGLPVGATALFAPNAVTASGSTTLTIITTAAVQPGTYPLTITATNPTVSHQSVVSLVVSPTPTFTLSLASVSQTVSAGVQASFGVTVAPLNGFAGTVSFEVSGLPVGATATFSPGAVTTSGNTTLSVSTISSTQPNTYMLSVRAVSGTIVQTSAVSLIVNAPIVVVNPAPVISSISPASVAAGTVVLTVNGSGFLAGSIVRLTVRQLPLPSSLPRC